MKNFKVGDRVKVLCLDQFSDPRMERMIGATGTVVKIFTHPEPAAWVKIDNELPDWAFDPSSLEEVA
jgi:hypothetical protein